MTTKTKLIILAIILVGAPMAFNIININIHANNYLFYYSPFAMEYFGVVLALYFMRLKSGNLDKIRLFLNGGIYLSIVIVVSLAFYDIYYYWSYLNMLYELLQYSDYFVEELGHFLQDQYISMFPSFVYIALMYLSLRINKDIEKESQAFSKV